MSLVHSISHPSRLHDIRFCKPIASHEREILLVAAEDKKVSVYTSLPGRHHPTAGYESEGADEAGAGPKLVAVMVGHENRYASFPLKLPNLLSGYLPQNKRTTNA